MMQNFVLNFSGNLLVTGTSSNFFFFWNLVRLMMHLWINVSEILQFVVQLFFWCFTMGFHCLTKKKHGVLGWIATWFPLLFLFLQAMRAGHCLQSAWNFWYGVVRNSSFESVVIIWTSYPFLSWMALCLCFRVPTLWGENFLAKSSILYKQVSHEW